jgi:hypothetical protein
MILKRLEEGADFPNDFWNYRLNPILGYEYKPVGRVTDKEEQKYNKTTQAI